MQFINDYPYVDKQLALDLDVSLSTIRQWKSGTNPRDDNLKKLEKLMSKTKDEKIPFHPSYGYAMPEQIERLGEIGICVERDRIMAQIAKQSKSKGKKIK